MKNPVKEMKVETLLWTRIATHVGHGKEIMFYSHCNELARSYGSVPPVLLQLTSENGGGS